MKAFLTLNKKGTWMSVMKNVSIKKFIQIILNELKNVMFQ